MSRVNQPGGPCRKETFVVWGEICFGYIYYGFLHGPDERLKGFHVPDRSRALLIYPVATIRRRVTYAKLEKD